MSAVLEGAVPPLHLPLATKASSWRCSYNPLTFNVAPTSSPAPMSPESLHSYIPHHHDSPLPSHDIGVLSTSGWFAAPVLAPDHHETAYTSYTYDQPYVTPHPSSVTFSPPTQFSTVAETTVSAATIDPLVAAYSPVSEYSKMSEPVEYSTMSEPVEYSTMSEPVEYSTMSEPVEYSTMSEPVYRHHLDESYSHAPRTSMDSLSVFQVESDPPSRPRSSPSTFTPNHPASGSIDYPWQMDPLGISSPVMHEHCYSNATYPSPRRMYAAIAPHPMAPQRANVSKRSRDEDATPEQARKRQRSDSSTTPSMELGEEDKLLIQLKEEESMPWKDIAARFQKDLGKTYQIPALQMRLKRLRERLRTWTEADMKALRMAHEYWAQSKFDIISQKMLEYGAAEKWTARQCARKWAEIDPGPTPYTTYDHHATPSYAPYTMSPVDQTTPYMPYPHIL